MAIKKVRIRPPGYTDIIHPETQADITKYDNSNSELVATNVQSAIDEINTKIEENKIEIVDGLTSTDATKVLSAKQGKVLKDLVDSKWVYNEDTIKNVKVNNAVNADTVNGKTVESNVPSNAKFTDTTYSEISTSEIDAGTSSTLRTISGRRIKYILDKVQGWINALTKADVGLGNVLNYGVATQAEAQAGTSNAKYMTPIRTKEAIQALQAVSSVNSKTGAVTLSKSDVGLGNVDDVKQATKAEFDEHKADTTNPHGVTKSQVGLGSVQNYGIATQAEAESGTVNTKYITPLRVKQAIQALESVSSVAGKKGAVTLTKADVGLSNVDNVKQATKTEHEALDARVTSHLADGASHSKTARFVVGTSTAGWTSKDVDYLCDGTNDQIEINNAITALPATGGEIVILDGTYNITAKINVNKNNVSIRGNGDTTILKRMFNSSVKEGVITLTGRSGCKIADLQVDGNKTDYTNSNNYGIYLTSSSNNITVTSNTCNNNNTGIYLASSNSHNITVTSNTCNDNNYGIYLSSAGSNTVTGNTCNNNNSYGICLDTSSNNTITGNTCNNNSYGIRLESSSNNTITGNTCNDNNYGIDLSSSSNNTITGNTYIRGTGLTTDYTASQHTIRLRGTDNSYNLVSNNNCMGKAVVVDGGTGNSVWGNKYDSGDDLPIVIGETQPNSGWWFEEID
jgi:parallel beta-helix repeat protein